MTVTGSVISFTFDDVYASQFTNARPILTARGWSASAYVIQDRLDTAGYLTTAQLASLADLSDWDIGLHAFSSTVHNAVNGNTTYSSTPAVLRDDWTAQQQALQALGHTRGLGHYAYPQGKFDAVTLAEVKKRFLSARTTISRGIETVPPADVFRLRAIQCGNTTALTPNSTVGTLQWYVDQVGTFGGWLILCFHDVITTATNTLEFSTANFQTLCDYIQTANIPVRTVGEVLGSIDTSLLVPKSLVDAKGDLLTGTADNTVARLAAGADETMLIADSSQTPGMRWQTRAADIQTFTANATWTKPAGAVRVRIICQGSGGGGGSGRKGAAGTVRAGGGGGGAGGRSEAEFAASSLPATLAVACNATANPGGAAQATNSTDGVTGSGGAVSQVTGGNIFVRAAAGGGGSGGTSSSGAGGSSGSAFNPGGAGGSASTTGLVGAIGGSSVVTACGGGSGGGITSANVASAGGAGGLIQFNGAQAASGAAGAIASPGGVGVDQSAVMRAYGFGGTGAGGGGSSLVGDAGAGGAGTALGAGGGGGGASVDSVGNSGAGGAGGPGIVVIVTTFA